MTGQFGELSTKEIKEKFVEIISGEAAGEGLKAFVEAGLLIHIVGTLAEMMPKGTKERLRTLMENIDKTKPIRERRLGLFFLCFEKKRVIEAILLMEFDEKTTELLLDGMKYLDAMSFFRTRAELKQFAGRRGLESYEYLEGLSKAQRIVYDLPESIVLNRYQMMEEIKKAGEPVFTTDLDITEDDLIDHEIAAGEKADRILEALLTLVHKQPKLNRKKALLFYAKKYAKNPLLPAFQKVKQLR